MQFSVTTFFALLFLSPFFPVLSSARPIQANSELVKRDVFVPPIIEPLEGTEWKTGEVYRVAWDTSNAPAQITNPEGSIQLRVNNFTMPLILAKGFNILDGFVEITVPRLITGDNYRVVLFGDSGNISPPFTIQGEDY